MSEETPNEVDAPDDVKGKPRKDARPASERDADATRLAQLQKEYDQLRDQLKRADSPASGDGAKALARKSEVAAEIIRLRNKPPSP